MNTLHKQVLEAAGVKITPCNDVCYTCEFIGKNNVTYGMGYPRKIANYTTDREQQYAFDNIMAKVNAK